MPGNLVRGQSSTARHDTGVGGRTGRDYSVGSTRARHNAQDATSRAYPFWRRPRCAARPPAVWSSWCPWVRVAGIAQRGCQGWLGPL